MSSAPMTPLRQRMIEDMSIRQFGERTQQGYVAVVADFARFLGRSPDRRSRRICDDTSCTWPPRAPRPAR
jgi:hypothetical protein